ncbi:hypothetical protein [Aquipseudomonas alcaligenes]|uniref:hypothetical protein n=1 Tax=Aquipseudomonas alcaligenes TaxID=43263 RepID=UPI00117B1CC7|nr:hypothetical protein [Pseudomonas alcaligenes]
MNITDASLGSIFAAVVAGAISLISLVISKENKTSEFRQLWIDSLRSELSLYVSHSMEIYRHRRWEKEQHGEKWESIVDSYLKANELITKIRLRLNPKEKSSRKILSMLREYEVMFSDNAIPEDRDFNRLNHAFVGESQRLLKSEWNRVRNGEIVFQVVRSASFSVLMVGLIALAYYFYM